MSATYGNNEEQVMKFRELSGGRLKTEEEGGRQWPPSFKYQPNACFKNRPPNETRCHDSATPATNILIGGNLIFLLFFRLHNSLAKELEAINPCWDDDKLFYTVREIVIAMGNQVIYYEWAPEVLGYEYLVKNKVIFPGALHVDDYDPELEPRVSIEYVTATRWFHLLQEGRGNLYNKDGKLWGSVPIVDLTLRTGALPLNNTIDGLMQGSFRQGCAFNENTVDPDIGERILSDLQRASDVLASDLMKGRDTGLPPYNEYRKLCKLPVAKSFKDLHQWIGKEQVETMETLYESVDDVEVMAGIYSEKPMRGALAGPTLACIMTEQLLRWRRADRFWYQGVTHPYGFSPEQLKAIQDTSLSKVICDHGDSVIAVQPNPFVLPGPGNEIIDCKYYKGLNLELWRDPTCKSKREEYQQYEYEPNQPKSNWY
ncbi:peroxidase-like [Amyelois transitella]|uniref:peroxidase-like n=1 Tax=Amyelois transitella TaxID=680683 RepID=UPI00298F9EE7|nr:peroxidase-like [Amyelois transitella]